MVVVAIVISPSTTCCGIEDCNSGCDDSGFRRGDDSDHGWGGGVNRCKVVVCVVVCVVVVVCVEGVLGCIIGEGCWKGRERML